MDNKLAWYHGSCRSANIMFWDVTTKKSKTTQITDPAVIKQITDLLDKLPVSGDIMVSMGPSSVTKLTLDCDKSQYEIQFFGDRLKTPATSFYSPSKPEEKALFDLLKNL